MKITTALAGLAITGALVVTAIAPTAPAGEASGGARLDPGPGESAAGGGAYEMPLDGEVVAQFDDPDVPWGRGHRGVDIVGEAGAEVLAAADGVVAFVGVVVDRPVISIDHPDGIRTTYEPVAALVEVGDAVGQGEVIGTLVSEGSHCRPAACLHWGAKIGDDYLDPLSLLREVVIRLYPTGQRSPPPVTPAGAPVGRRRAVARS